MKAACWAKVRGKPKNYSSQLGRQNNNYKIVRSRKIKINTFQSQETEESRNLVRKKSLFKNMYKFIVWARWERFKKT